MNHYIVVNDTLTHRMSYNDFIQCIEKRAQHLTDYRYHSRMLAWREENLSEIVTL